MAIEDALNVFENSLRDLVERVLRQRDGDRWLANAGVSGERVQVWNERLSAEPKRRPGGDIEQRIVYYSDFYDIVEIVTRNWEAFQPCFNNKTRFAVYADRLRAFRDPDAHSRSLMPFEEQLILGMTGELRQEITVFLSSGGGGPEPEHFARIEEIRDNFGARATGASSGGGVARPPTILRPGDVVSFVGRAWDPKGDHLKWEIFLGARSEIVARLDGPELAWDWHVTEPDIHEESSVYFEIISSRPYSRQRNNADDSATFIYAVLPLLS